MGNEAAVDTKFFMCHTLLHKIEQTIRMITSIRYITRVHMFANSVMRPNVGRLPFTKPDHEEHANPNQAPFFDISLAVEPRNSDTPPVARTWVDRMLDLFGLRKTKHQEYWGEHSVLSDPPHQDSERV